MPKRNNTFPNLAQLGWACIPIPAGEKGPRGNAWQKSDPLNAKGYNRQLERGGNIGVRMGDLLPNGARLYALDVDVWSDEPKHSREALDVADSVVGEHHEMPQAVSGREGGRSRHIYFGSESPLLKELLGRSSETVEVDGKERPAWEVTLRGDGHQMVAPPSTHPDSGERYYWLRPPAENGLVPVVEWDQGTPYDPGPAKEPTGISYKDGRRIVMALADDDHDRWVVERDGWRDVGMALSHEFEGSNEAFELWRDFSRLEKGAWNEREGRSQWSSFKDKAGAITMRSLAFHAGLQDLIYQAVTANDFDDLDIEDCDCSLDDRLISVDEFDGTKSRKALIKNLLSLNDVACVFGDPGSGKSLLAPLLSFLVAHGKPIWGNKVQRGRVFYVAAEDQHGMEGRCHALREIIGTTDAFHIVDDIRDLASKGSPDRRDLYQLVKRHRPKMVVIDTAFEAFAGLDFLSAQDASRIVAFCRKLTRLKCAVVLVHHQAKTAGDTPYGSVELNRAFDATFRLTNEGGRVAVRVHKNRNGPSGQTEYFQIETLPLGMDEDGDPISVAYAREATPWRDGPELPRGHSGDIIRCLTAEPMTLAEWRDAYVATLEIPPNTEAIKKRMQSAKKCHQHVATDGERYWRIGLPVTAADFDDEDVGEEPGTSRERLRRSPRDGDEASGREREHTLKGVPSSRSAHRKEKLKRNTRI